MLLAKLLSFAVDYLPPPLTENHPAQKPLAEMGGPPPLLNGQI